MSFPTRLRVSEEEVCPEMVEGEAIIMNMSNGVSYSLDGVGGVVWEMITRGYTSEKLTAAISAH